MYLNVISATGNDNFRIAAAIISLTCIFYTILMRKRQIQRRRLFLMLLVITLVDSLTGIIATMTQASVLSYEFKLVVTYLCKFIYYATHFALVYIFFQYIINVCNLQHKYSIFNRRYTAVPFIFTELLLLSNPFTGIVFSANPSLIYSRNLGVYIAYFVSALYLIQSIFILVKYWHTINHLKKTAMFYFMSLAIIGIIVQMLFPLIVCELLFEAIGLMGIMIMIEKEDDKLDISTNAYNRIALINDLNSYIKMDIPTKIICIRIENAEAYRRITGYETFDSMLVDISDFLIYSAVENNVYKVGDANFFIICPRADKAYMTDLSAAIKERFQLGFDSSEGTSTIVETIICASFPEQLKAPEDIILLADAPLNISDYGRILSDDDLDYLIRNIAIEKAISKGISGNSFKVYYQPIYGKSCGCIKAMQALLKLNTPALGDINFNEFMPIAERAGFADTLEAKMIESIFAFVGGTVKDTLDNLDFVLIHLMSIKVVNRSLVETIMGLKYKYNVNPALIAFDIDDTILNFGNENIAYVLNELYEAGFKLYLGNYDISNLGQNEAVLNKFEGVVLTAWKFINNQNLTRGNVVLKTRTEMLEQLGKEVIITGIDDDECYKTIGDTSSKYMSGKVLSTPLSKEDILEKFNSKDKVKAL